MITFGVIGAMEEEIQHLKDIADITGSEEIAGMVFYKGTYGGKNIVLVKSGIGKVNAAVCAQILKDHFGADAVINTGIAGSMDKNVHLGDVVVSEDLVHHDFDTSTFDNTPRGMIPRLNMRFFKADERLIKLAVNSAEKVLDKAVCHVGRIASGDQFISNPDIKKEIAEEFKPLCVEMEGAAIAQTCFLNKIPFVIIRSISDNSDGNVEVYQNTKELAVKNSAVIVAKIIEDYNN